MYEAVALSGRRYLSVKVCLGKIGLLYMKFKRQKYFISSPLRIVTIFSFTIMICLFQTNALASFLHSVLM